MNKDIRKITEGAMMAAIVGVLLLINRQAAGMLVEMFVWALPLPMVLYSAKYGWKTSWMLFVSILLLAVILGTPQTIFYVAYESLIGMVYGCGINTKVQTRKLVFRTMILGVLMEILTSVIFASFFGYDLLSEGAEYQKIITETFQSMGRDVPSSMNLAQLVRSALMVSIVLVGVLNSLITHMLSRILLSRFHYPVEKMQPFINYAPAKWSGYAGIVCLFLFYGSTYYGTLLEESVVNVLQGIGLLGTFYLVMYGMLSLSVTLQLYLKNKFLALIATWFLSIFMALAVAILGFLYITTDLRNRLLEEAHASKSR